MISSTTNMLFSMWLILWSTINFSHKKKRGKIGCVHEIFNRVVDSTDLYRSHSFRHEVQVDKYGTIALWSRTRVILSVGYVAQCVTIVGASCLAVYLAVSWLPMQLDGKSCDAANNKWRSPLIYSLCRLSLDISMFLDLVLRNYYEAVFSFMNLWSWLRAVLVRDKEFF